MPDRTPAEALLDWYAVHQRILPWRGIHDPYATWVSETMLQQTRVDTVLTYYPRFLAAFPDVRSLAEAPLDDVLKLWEGLGYYRRAQNLHRGAKQIAEEYGGVIPSTAEELKKIHGIGDYTAGAIASIAFDQPVPAVDGNVIRVISRLCGIRASTALPQTLRDIRSAAASLVPADAPGDFAQAMMDLGATVCVPGTPSCAECPLSSFCDAYRAGDAEALPVIPRKKPPRPVSYDLLLLITNDRRILVRQRTESMLQGLWCFPMTEGHRPPEALPSAFRRLTTLSPAEITPLGEARHVFTHQVWEMKLYTARTDSSSAPEGWCFISAQELKALAFPTAVRKARAEAERLLAQA